MLMKSIACDCGVSFQTDSETELVARAQHHAREVHRMELTREQILAMAQPVAVEKGKRGGRRPRKQKT